MPTRKRLSAPLILMFGLIIAMVPLAGPTNAAPYSNQPSVSVSTQTPRMGSAIRFCGRGFHARSSVKVTLDHNIWLARLPTNSSGAFCATVKLPARISGGHRIWANDPYRHSASSWIRILRPGVRVAGVSATASGATGTTGTTGTTSEGTSGLLAFTGSTLIGIGALGALLVAGGGLLLFTGKRRKADS
jgi:hypothetical protein